MLRMMSELNLMQIHSSVLLLGIVPGKKHERSILKTSCFQKGYYVPEIIIAVDHVFLWRQNYKQTSLKSHGHHKLTPKFYGPYHIIKHIGQFSYKLPLPAPFKIHLVFHVFCLKKVVDKNYRV